ncbi:MAG TPA: hypothetical protein P5514_01410 [Bacteroidales bacterium]|nr:hypothetical protein [Bacteroidales bacterium]HRX95574.1 hypothetical protein [Bacteroidales bacterium]
MQKRIILISIYFIAFTFAAQIFANPGGDDDFNKGITVSPSHVNFNVDPGNMAVKKIKVSNYTDKTQKFNVVYNDFDISKDGKSSFLEPGTSDFSLSRFINISPTFIELGPGANQEVTLTVQVPSDPEMARAAWGVIVVEQVEEKKALDPGNETGKTIAFGITPTFAFGVWVYQNPSKVEDMHVDITNFMYEKQNENQFMMLKVENKGNGISFCKAYVEITNLDTGEQFTLGGKRYTILPGYERTFVFEPEARLQKGNYSAVGVLDYNSDEELVAAELEFKIE